MIDSALENNNTESNIKIEGSIKIAITRRNLHGLRRVKLGQIGSNWVKLGQNWVKIGQNWVKIGQNRSK